MWKTVQLGDLCEILDTRRKPITKKDRIHGEYPYYGATGIVDWVADYIFDEELVLIGEDGAKWDAGEKTAFIVDGKYWVNNHAHVVKPNTEKLLNKWLTYYLCGIDLKPWVTGMTVPKLNQRQLKSIPIPLPPLAEQERIVAKLDAAFAEIDKAVELGQERLSRAEKALGQIVDNELSELREEHESCVLGEMLESVEYGTSTKCSKTGKYPVLRMGNMQTGSFVMDDLVYLDSDLELEKYRVRKGDVFFNRTNSALHVGKAAIYDGGSDCLFAGYLIRLNYSDDVLDGRFLNYYLNAPSTRAYGYSVMTSSVNQSNINGTKLKEYPFIKVDLKTQNCIRKKLDEITALLSQVHFLLRKSLNEYAHLKSAILSKELMPNKEFAE